ncbi:MAG: tetratricopeptide repeat protein [Acidobacteriota bacterium]|nr:tetratricopeptide repeat protein [Acidobacteriota bacterium]MDP9113036.1 tetratricopeptide repeat protein [Acidobacteriota bacterium]
MAIWLGLLLSSLAVYSQVASFDFINYDDPAYVYQNPHVLAGLTLASVKWALTAVVDGNWIPVTLLSHILDVQLFGMRSGMHHLVNVSFHALSALLLFLSLRRVTGARGLSAFVAFVFALHPLHVGSVAWVAERKDVLSAFFWFLALYAYLRYTERPSLGRYWAVVAPFCLGLMSKPMLVTFPFTLWLLDLWPLRRAQWPMTIVEKLPLIALSAGASVVTYVVQGSAGFLASIPLATRIENVFVSYLGYIGQMFWPTRLAVYYPYPPSIPLGEPVAAFAVILAISFGALGTWRTRPYLAVGWFWYLGTLLPVIGLVHVGSQAHADRYMYIPMVGLSIVLAWGAADVAAKWPRTKPLLALAAAVSCSACLALAWREAAYWKNSETLFQRAIEVTQHNSLAENNLGMYLTAVQRNLDAISHFETALEINPNYTDAHTNLGFVLSQTPERIPDAVKHYQAALRLKPDSAEAHNGLGAALVRRGDCAAAIPHFEAALHFKPDQTDAIYNLGTCQMTVKNYLAAVPYFEAAIRAQPGFAEAHFSLAGSLSRIPNRVPDAIKEYQATLQLQPNEGLARLAHAKLGMLLADQGRAPEAIPHLEAVQRIQPDPSIAKLLDRLRAAQH